jgi:hypothetical protein
MTTPRGADLQQRCSADVPESVLPVYSLLVGEFTPEGVHDGAIGIGGGLGGAEGGAHQYGAGGPGNGGDAHLTAHLIEARQAGQGLTRAEVVQGQHRVGLIPTEVGLQLDHRFTALAVEPFEGVAQQRAKAGGDERAAVELAGIGVLLCCRCHGAPDRGRRRTRPAGTS